MKAFVFWLFVVFGLSITSCYASQKYEVKVKTVLNVRAAPNAGAILLGTIKDGEHIEVYNIFDGWAKIRYKDQDAYVSSEFLVLVDNSKVYDSSIVFGGQAKEILVYIILALSVIIFIVKKMNDLEDAEGFLLISSYLLLLALFVLELVYFWGFNGDTWFCSPDEVGWFLTIVNFFIFGAVLFNQVFFFFDILAGIKYNSTSIDYRVGFYSLGIAFGLCIIAYFLSEEFIPVIGILLGVAQVIQVVFIFLESGRYYWKYAIAITIIYLVGMVATIISLIHFIPLLIVAALIWFVLSLFGSKSSRACRNCRSYDGSYCHYRGCYTSPGSCCNKHEYS